MKKMLLLAILLSAILSIYCQTTDTVTLKDGTVITGTITQYEAGKYVIITLPQGGEKMLNWDVISSVDRNSETPPTPAPQPNPTYGKPKMNINGGIKLQYDETLPSDKLREYWQRQGGNRTFMDYYLNVISVRMKNPAKTGMNLNGGGFGYGGSVNWLYFNPPDYTRHKLYSVATKVGVCGDLNLNFFTTKNHTQFPDPMGGSDYYINTDTDIMNMNLDLGTNLGVNVGLGAFLLSQKWYGAVMGLTWRPLYRYTSTNVNSTTSSNVPGVFGASSHTSNSDTFDTGSLEYSLELGSVKALTNKFAPRSALKINFIYVPAFGKNKIEMMMFGIGVGQYK